MCSYIGISSYKKNLLAMPSVTILTSDFLKGAGIIIICSIKLKFNPSLSQRFLITKICTPLYYSTSTRINTKLTKQKAVVLV